jgi:hypothetical protein
MGAQHADGAARLPPAAARDLPGGGAGAAQGGADPNARLKRSLWYTTYNRDNLRVDFAGATPFFRAAYATDVEAMKLLLAAGADPTIATIKPRVGTISVPWIVFQMIRFGTRLRVIRVDDVAGPLSDLGHREDREGGEWTISASTPWLARAVDAMHRGGAQEHDAAKKRGDA